MSNNYKEILRLLYDEFGDDLIDAGKEAVHDMLKKNNVKNNNSENEESDNEIVLNTDDATCNLTEITEKNENLTESIDYYDADVFEQQAISKLEESVAEVVSPIDAAEAVKDLILMAGEVRKFEEAQITVRSDIAANRDIALAKIEAQKVALMTYLDKSFDERKENFNSLFAVVDDALEKDNMQQLALSLESIIKLADSSPFKDLKSVEETANALSNPDHEWDF